MRIKETIDLTTGLFQHIENPLWEDRYEPFDMDLEFLTSHGEKLISPLVKYFVKDGKVDEEGAKHIINLIYRKYKDSWERQYEVLDVTYEILDNYVMIETEEIDRDTLEKNISDLLRTNSETKTQINDLLEKIDRSEQNTIDRTGSDIETAGEERNANTEANTHSDVERNESKTDTLSFNNRKDITQGNRDLMNTDSGNKSTEINRTETDSETGYREGKIDEGFESETTTTELGTTTKDDKSSVYGFNSITPTPSEEGEGTQEIDSNKTDTTTSDKNTSSREDVDITNRKTVQGEDVETHSNSVNELETNQGETTKTGSEVTATTGNGRDVTNETNESTSNESTSLNRSGEYSNKDTATSSTTNETANTGSVNTDSEITGSEKGTVDTTGELNEVRTLERKGNLGVATTSKILQEHIEFWKFNFLDQVYKDVSEMMTLKIY